MGNSELCRVRWRGARVVLASCLCLGIATAGALAEPAEAPKSIEVELVVVHISTQEGEIDPGAQKIHRKLSKEFRYQSLKVLESERMTLAIDEVGGLVLPNGRKVQVKPLVVDKHGALIAVDVEGMIKTDLKVASGHLVIIGADRYEDGKLVVSLEAHF